MKLILLGYMGSGKSIVGKDLANNLNRPFIDLDSYIESQEVLEISEIFSKKGAVYFRKTEHYALLKLLQEEHSFVLALGGGTPCYANNMNCILNTPDVVSIYLKTSIRTLAYRLREEFEKRPLLKGLNTIEMLEEFIGKHMLERSYYYNQANYIVNTDNKTPKAVAEEIVNLI